MKYNTKQIRRTKENKNYFDVQTCSTHGILPCAHERNIHQQERIPKSVVTAQKLHYSSAIIQLAMHDKQVT